MFVNTFFPNMLASNVGDSLSPTRYDFVVRVLIWIFSQMANPEQIYEFFKLNYVKSFRINTKMLKVILIFSLLDHIKSEYRDFLNFIPHIEKMYDYIIRKKLYKVYFVYYTILPMFYLLDTKL